MGLLVETTLSLISNIPMIKAIHQILKSKIQIKEEMKESMEEERTITTYTFQTEQSKQSRITMALIQSYLL